MNGLLPAVVFAALFYLQINPSKVKARMNLMVAWFIFIGALAVSLLSAINLDVSRWINAIQETALAVAVFFMLISVDPSSTPNVAKPASTPPAPPAPPQQ